MQQPKQLSTKEEFEQFFIAHHKNLVRYALKFVHRSDVAADIVQEAFVKLWENRNHILATISLKAYLYKVVHNLSLNYIEQQKLHEHHHNSIYTDLMEMEMDYYKEEKSMLQDERIESVQRMVRALPKGCYEIIDLSRFQGLRNKEIAKKLNLPLRTIETRIYRCMSRLRDMINSAV
ncbi:RNA polymerase sigma-70 factor [Carboxylicivirga taeanensis]|uniref:RNA polymerase sigma-70 factor n=1 Tax=Carboxylicivirga taeanensis TaxID=1416875 RepID=UPI003F6DC5E2